MSAATTLIKHGLKIGAIEFISEGRKLNSNRYSPYFFNSGLFTSGESLNLLGDILAETFKLHWEELGSPTVIFGPAYKGITLATLAVSSLSLFEHRECKQIRYAHDRKEKKTHGEGGIIVGAAVKGQRVVIVDDAITTGVTKDQAVELITRHGGIVTGLVPLFDREERTEDSNFSAAQVFAQRHKVPVIAAATLSDLIKHLKTRAITCTNTRVALDAILEYQELYGAI